MTAMTHARLTAWSTPALAVVAALLSACTATGQHHACCSPTASPVQITNAAAALGNELSVGETPWWQITASQHRTSAAPSHAPRTPTAPRRVTLDGGVLFEPDSAALTPGAASQLAVILDQIRSLPGSRVVIDGYTNDDGGPPAGALLLSRFRARSIKRWLVGNGVPPSRVTTRGWGDARPVYPHPTSAAQRAANRRCTISVTAGTP